MGSALSLVHSDEPTCSAPGVPLSDLARRAEGQKLSDERIAGEILGRLRASRDATRYEREYLWPRNLLFAYGEQWVGFNQTGKRWLTKQRDKRELRYTVNVLQGRLRQKAAKLTAARPGFAPLPENTDWASRQAAKLAERVLHHDWHEFRCGTARLLAVIDCLIFGTGILEYGWDPLGGKLRPVPVYDTDESGRTRLDVLGNPVPKMRRGRPIVNHERDGSIYVRAISPLHTFTPPGVPSHLIEDCRWFQRITWMTTDEARERFGLEDDLDFGDPDPDFELNRTLSSYLQRYSLRNAGDPRDTGERLVIEHYEKAADVKGWEDGAVFTVVGNKLVDRREMPLPASRRYPFVVLPWMPIRGQFLSHAYLTDLIDPQKRINQTTSHGATHLSLYGLPTLLNPKGSAIPRVLNLNGGRIDFNPAAGPPGYLTPPAMAANLMEFQDRAIRDLDAVSQDYAYGRGEPVQNTPSALYANLMQDADAQDIGPVLDEHAQAFAELGEGMLELEHLYGDDERLLQIIGRGNRCELTSFRGSDIPLGMRVRVQEGSMRAVAPAARIAQAKELLSEGWYGELPLDGERRRALLEFVRMPELVDLETGESLLERFAQDVASRVVDRGEELPVPDEWEPPVLVEVKEAIQRRLLQEDRWDMPPEVVEKAVAYVVEVSGRIAEFEQLEQQAQQEQMQAQLDMQIQLEQAKTEGKVRERTMGELASAAGEALVNQGVQAPAQETSDGDSEPPPPDSE